MAKDEARKLSTVQEIMIGSTDYLRRIIAIAGGREGGQGGVAMSYLCPHYDSFPSGGARSAEKKYDRKQPNRLFSGANRRKC